MSKKQKTYTITAEQMFDFHKPKFNGFGCGHGAHKNKRVYSRKDKSWRKEVYYHV